MPRFVRPFWIEALVDGYRKEFQFGPRYKTGQFEMAIKQRDNGSVSPTELVIHGFVSTDGKVTLIVKDGGTVVYKKETTL